MPSPRWNRARILRTLFSILAAALLMFWMLRGSVGPQSKRVPYSEFVAAIEADKVQEAEVRPDEVLGTLRGENGKRGDTVMTDRVPNMDERALLESMKQHRVVVTGHPERASWWGAALWSMVGLEPRPPNSGARRASRRRATVPNTSRAFRRDDRVSIPQVTNSLPVHRVRAL